MYRPKVFDFSAHHAFERRAIIEVSVRAPNPSVSDRSSSKERRKVFPDRDQECDTFSSDGRKHKIALRVEELNVALAHSQQASNLNARQAPRTRNPACGGHIYEAQWCLLYELRASVLASMLTDERLGSAHGLANVMLFLLPCAMAWTMDKIDVSEFLGKRRVRDASPPRLKRHVSDLTYNAFLGFPVAVALAALIRRLKDARLERCELGKTLSHPTAAIRRTHDASPAREGHVSNLTYNAFFAFPVAQALTSWGRRLKKCGARRPLGRGTADHARPPGPDSQRAVTAFGEPPPVPGSTEVAFRN